MSHIFGILQDASHHQRYYNYGRGFQAKPSLATATVGEHSNVSPFSIEHPCNNSIDSIDSSQLNIKGCFLTVHLPKIYTPKR